MTWIRELIAMAIVSVAAMGLSAQEARQVVERGMKARCENVDLLTKQRSEIITLQGKIVSSVEQESTGEIQADWPSSFRWDQTLIDPVSKDKKRVVFGIRLDKGWNQASPNPVVDIGLVQVDELRMQMYGRWLITLYPLKDKAFTLTLSKDNRVGEEDVSVVKAALPFRPDVYLSFSKKSGHLLKVAYRAREGGADIRLEHVLADYKEFDGIKLPTRMIDFRQSGTGPVTKIAEWNVTGYKFVDKFDADVFEKPMPKK